MLKNILGTTALATLLAAGLHAQEATTADPAQDPAAPVVEGAEGMEGDAATETEAVAPVIVEGEAADPATDPAVDPAAVPEVAEDPAATPEIADDTGEPATDMVEGAETPAEATGSEVVQEGEVGTTATDTMAAEDWAPIDVSTVSAEQLMGADIVTYENETIATIEDVLISDDGAVENLVARFGGFLGFGSNRVLLTMDEVEVLQDANESLIVRTDLTPESIEGRPEYEEEQTN